MSLHSSGLLIPTMVLPRSFGRGTAMDRYEQWHLSLDAAERYERVVARYILGPSATSHLTWIGPAAREVGGRIRASPIYYLYTLRSPVVQQTLRRVSPG